MHRKHGRHEWDENTNRFEHALEKLEDSLQWFYNATINRILDKRPGQKIRVRIDNYDTWSMDHTLAPIILPMLKQLKETKHGSPWVDDEDVPEELRSTNAPPKENNWDTDDFHHLRWDWVMDEMIWAFHHKVDDDWEDQFFHEDGMVAEISEIEFKGIGPAQLRLFPDEDGTMEDYEYYEWVRGEQPRKYDKEGHRRYLKRIENGVRLFGKYYQSLWD
jgi:hypothetical protein